MRTRLTLAAGLAAALAAGLAAPAAGITFGQPDDGSYPEVGALIGEVDGLWYQWCTGTLVNGATPGSLAFLTAAHCLAPFDDVNFKVTFAAVIDADEDGVVDPGVVGDAAATFDVVGVRHVNPAYGSGGANDPHDVAVLTLNGAPANVTPAVLPSAGLLDDQRWVRGLRFTTVGYGTVRSTNQAAFQNLEVGWQREVVQQSVMSVTKAWITFSMVPATGNGGTCYGDSGGPHFLPPVAGQPHVVVSVTVTGDYWCKATDRTYRLDTASARGFLDGLVALPSA